MPPTKRHTTLTSDDSKFTFEVEAAPRAKRRLVDPVYKTSLGTMHFGDSLEILSSPSMKKLEGKVQLVFTSPPFPLNTKKEYGNHVGEDYIEWFGKFAEPLKKLLTKDGSIVIEIGNAWEPKRPVMSTVVLRALLKFLEKGGLNLCQEFVWYNPARLPSPVEWVNVRRIRVKDAFSKIWWMSSTDHPKADNRKILKAYSKSMERLLASGKYNSGKRPSEHNIGEISFTKDNSGAIPPNVIGADDAPLISSLLKETNTRSTGAYQKFCRENDITQHPARMPPEIAEFFVRFLTDERDLVLDPFGGSNTTGEVSEKNNRKWISIDAQWGYASSSIGRFSKSQVKKVCPEIKIKKIKRPQHL